MNCSVSSWTLTYIQVTCKGSDQTVRILKLIWHFAGRTYHIVGNLMSRYHWQASFSDELSYLYRTLMKFYSNLLTFSYEVMQFYSIH